MNQRVRENNLWAWLRRAEKVLGAMRQRLHWRRLENGVGYGDPDVEGCFLSACFNIELKAVPRQELIDCELRPHQAQWARSRALAGGASFVLVQVGSDSAARRYLVSAAQCQELLRPITEKRLEALALISPFCKPQDVLNHVSLHRQDPVLDSRGVFEQ